MGKAPVLLHYLCQILPTGGVLRKGQEGQALGKKYTSS